MVELIHTFRLPVPLPRAWAALDDPDLVAAAYPGASVRDRDHDTLHGRLDVKIGPTVVSYEGRAQVTWRDQPARRFVLEVAGQEVGATGTLAASINATLREAPSDAEATEVELRTVLQVTGRVAQFGEGILSDVFARQLQDLAAGLVAAGLPETAPPLAPAAEPEPEAGSAAEPASEQPPEPESFVLRELAPEERPRRSWSSSLPPPPPPPSTAAPATPGAEAGVGEQGSVAGAPGPTAEREPSTVAPAPQPEPATDPEPAPDAPVAEPEPSPPVLRPERPAARARVRNLAERPPRPPATPPSRPPAAVPSLSTWAAPEPPAATPETELAPATEPPSATPEPEVATPTPQPATPSTPVLAPKPAPEPADESTLVSKAAPYAVLLLVLWILRRLFGSDDG